jgi:hypothetical protein
VDWGNEVTLLSSVVQKRTARRRLALSRLSLRYNTCVQPRKHFDNPHQLQDYLRHKPASNERFTSPSDALRVPMGFNQ